MKNLEAIRLWVSSKGDPQSRYAPFPAPTTALPSHIALLPAKLFLCLITHLAHSPDWCFIYSIQNYPYWWSSTVLSHISCGGSFWQCMWMSGWDSGAEPVRTRWVWGSIPTLSTALRIWSIRNNHRGLGMRKLQSPDTFWLLSLHKIHSTIPYAVCLSCSWRPLMKKCSIIAEKLSQYTNVFTI